MVILGQDPYHGPGQAHGLSFSVQPGVEPPPSLLNIFKELTTDLGCTIPDNGCLKPWAEQGVLLDFPIEAGLDLAPGVTQRAAAQLFGLGNAAAVDRLAQFLIDTRLPVGADIVHHRLAQVLQL